MSNEELRKEIIASFADAYQNLGYSSLMGKIVALLLLSKEALSLDQISEQLEMSKGPISQITRRLKEHQLIERVWVPGDRKDYYRATNDIFGNAFKNYRSSMKRNKLMADRFIELSEKVSKDEYVISRMQEMSAFYELMESHNKQFLDEWSQIKESFKEKSQ